MVMRTQSLALLIVAVCVGGASAQQDPTRSASLSSSGKVTHQQPLVSSAAEALMRKVQKHMEPLGHNMSLIQSRGVSIHESENEKGSDASAQGGTTSPPPPPAPTLLVKSESITEPTKDQKGAGILITDKKSCDFTSNVKWSLVKGSDLNGDLNQDAGGKDAFLCQSEQRLGASVTGVKITEKKEDCNGQGARDGKWTLVPNMAALNGDLNQGAGGKDIFLCYQMDQADSPKITKLALTKGYCTTGSSRVTDPDGNLNGDLNQGAGGKDIFLCYFGGTQTDEGRDPDKKGNARLLSTSGAFLIILFLAQFF